MKVATEQFMHFGIRAITMDDIARLSGVSKKTIYQEFGDKNQLVYACFEQELQEDACLMEEGLEKPDFDVLHTLVGQTQHIRKRFSTFNPLVLHELQRYFPSCWELFENFKREVILKHIKFLLEKGKEQGYFRAEIDTRILAHMRLEQTMDTFDPLKFPPTQFDQVTLQLEIFDHFIHGILSDKGREAYLSLKQTN
ncbi:TetR family transcriptional regulator [Nitritalea halalkaliphila LW7]|uniref:TetR family transcriptional regulator n=1 Tax=Nitritalea halalkaliphila LW7 TaxID=1189621 RepID=I5C962_9BACT|nr:TetR/AcrR family transcriptional regulator [Nitritalea halalkaliphila]EIM78364.1 TetR family transcriptional regulator [Nitritalea halalkaliphila LW7]